MLVLPREEYGWLGISSASMPGPGVEPTTQQKAETAGEEDGVATGVPRPASASQCGYRDFVFAARRRGLQLRYLVRPYEKEVVVKNRVGLPAEQDAECMIELSLDGKEKRKLP